MASTAQQAKDALAVVLRLCKQSGLTSGQYVNLVARGFSSTTKIVHYDYPNLLAKPVALMHITAFYQYCFTVAPNAAEITKLAIFVAFCQHMATTSMASVAAVVATPDDEIAFPPGATDDEKGDLTHAALQLQYLARYPTEDTNGASDYIGGNYTRYLRLSFMTAAICTRLPLAEKPHLLAGRAETHSATLRLVEGNIECTNKTDHESTNRFGGVMSVAAIFGRLISMAGNYSIASTARGGGKEGFIGTTRLFATMRCANYFTKQCMAMVKNETGSVASFCSVLNEVLREFVDLVQKHQLKHADLIMEELCQRAAIWVPKPEMAKPKDIIDPHKGRGNDKDKQKRPCFKHFLDGSCSKGNSCPFRHNGKPPNNTQRGQHRRNEDNRSTYRSPQRDRSPPREEHKRVTFERRYDMRDDIPKWREDNRRDDGRRR